MKNRYILWVLAWLTGCSLYAQFDEPMKAFPTPAAAGFQIFGKIPVNGFTGIPEISIPLYECKIRTISLPVDLFYHPALVKPNIHPGWVGMGWSLMAGGCITRKVNCIPDEMKKSTAEEIGYLGNYSKIASDDWFSDQKIDDYVKAWGEDILYEVAPDEFSFNFCGYSGSFYLDHQGNWQVSSEVDIRVIFDKEKDCIPITGVRDNIKKGLSRYDAQATNSRLINSFTLVTPDGMKYRFGGKDATEYTIPYYLQRNGYLTASSWFLTEIISPENQRIVLAYEASDPIFEMRPFYSEMRDNDGHWSGCLFKGMESCRECMLMFPVYLKAIRWEGFEMTFFSRARNDLKLTATDSGSNMLLELIDPTDDRFLSLNVFYSTMLPVKNRGVFVKGKIDEFKWRQLDSIVVSGDLYRKKIAFTYNSLGSNRLKLASVSESGTGKHTFEYYQYGDGTWPTYFTDQEDHWGFYRKGKEYTGAVDKKQYGNNRTPAFDVNVRTSEVLATITYPSGGTTRFVYESNNYSSYMDSENRLVEKVNGTSAGGVRIKKIIRTGLDGTPEGTLSYYYKRVFDSLADTLTPGKSSGILAKEPVYNTSSFRLVFNDISVTEDYTLFSSGAIGPYLMNVSGSHIGYTNVTEVSQDGEGKVTGYSKKTFSNFGTDRWGKNHSNEPPLNSIKYDGYLLGPLSDKSMERGKLLSEELYTADGAIRKRTYYKYTPTPEKGFVRSISCQKLCLGDYGLDGTKWLACTDAYKTYLYSYNLTEKQEYDYGKLNGTYIGSSHFFSYDKYNILRSESHSSAYRSETVTTYKYPYDFPEHPVYGIMTEKHLFAPVEKRTVLKKVSGGQVFIDKEVFTYDIQGNVPFMSRYQRARKNEADLVEYYRCNRIDQWGNPASVVVKGEPETIYLWYSNLPVAKVINATYAEVWNVMRGQLREELLKEGLPGAQVTLFDYSDDGYRLWEQNPRGLYMYYKYNALGWLKAVYDDKSNLLKQMDYGYFNR